MADPQNNDGLLLSCLPGFRQIKEEGTGFASQRQVGRAAEGQREEAGERWGQMIYKRKQYWHLDTTINGVRYREALATTDRREAIALEKKRVAEIQAGKAASKAARTLPGSRLAKPLGSTWKTARGAWPSGPFSLKPKY